MRNEAAQGLKALLLARVKAGKLSLEGSGLLDPKLAVGEEGLPIHQQRSGSGKSAAEAVENRKAMRIEIPPVNDLRIAKPAGLEEAIDGIAFAKDQKALFMERKGEAVDLVFDHEDPFDGNRMKRKLTNPDGQIGIPPKTESRIEKPKAHKGRFFEEPVAQGEPPRAAVFRMDPLRGKDPVEKGGNQSFAPFDELGVDPRDVELPKVASVDWTPPEIIEDTKEPVHLLEAGIELERAIENPGFKLRKGRHNLSCRFEKADSAPLLADKGKAGGGIGEDDRRGDLVLPQDPVADGSPLDPEELISRGFPGRAGYGADPDTNLLESVEEVTRGDPGKRDSDGGAVLTVESPKKFPPLPEPKTPILKGGKSGEDDGAVWPSRPARTFLLLHGDCLTRAPL